MNTNQLEQSNFIPRRILVVDDEVSICSTVKEIFGEEGHEVFSATNAKNAIELIDHVKPELVFLDIWMPEMDGLEALKLMIKKEPELKIVMMSGHASISTAVEATRQGALDFLEKPFDLDALLAIVDKVFLVNALEAKSTLTPKSMKKVLSKGILTNLSQDLVSPVFNYKGLEGKKFKQKTLAQSAVLYGHGVHTGKKSGLVLEPLPVNSGIQFVNVNNLQNIIPAHIDYVDSTKLCTILRRENALVSTIEHLMSAFAAHGITNLQVKCNEEVPILDGSAEEFCTLFSDVGIKEQDEFIHAIKVSKEYRVGNDSEFIKIEPAESFIIDYTLKYPEPLGTQTFTYELTTYEDYIKNIAGARTFGFVKDIGALQAQGLAQGGRFNNFVLLGEEGVINSELRFPDEAVRHKVLDAIGDLYLLGRPLQGKVTACMTGHSDNVELLKLILKDLNL